MPSPFSCFSPSYDETLPRNNDKNKKRSVLDLNFNISSSNNDFGSNHMKTSPKSSNPLRFDDDYKKRNDEGNGIGIGFVSKRKSYKANTTGFGGSSNNSKRISKDIIGLPYNFIHKGGKSLDLNSARELQSTLDSVAAELGSSSSNRHSTPSIFPSSTPSQASTSTSLPVLSNRNSLPVQPLARSNKLNDIKPLPLPSFSASTTSQSNPKSNSSNENQQNNPTRQQVLIVKRKAAPPITKSVILQAGPLAVSRSASIPPSSVQSFPPVLILERRKDAVVEVEPTMSELGLVPDNRLGGNRNGPGGYMTETTKKKWQVSLSEIEDGLKL